MDKNKNYYKILGLNNNCTPKEIKKSYYKLSFKYHPDQNKDVDIKFFNEITEAYKILSDTDKKTEYDKKSKWGNNYDESLEMFDVDFEFDYNQTKKREEDFKKNYVNNIKIEVDDTFDGNLDYKRYVKCKSCDGTGKDMSSKIVIRDNNGNITKMFDGDDGCDYCEGSGKDYRGEVCSFCNGKGKIGLNPCKDCNGEKRILGKQKLKNIKLDGQETKLNAMGHYAKDGKTGYLLIVKTF